MFPPCFCVFRGKRGKSIVSQETWEFRYFMHVSFRSPRKWKRFGCFGGNKTKFWSMVKTYIGYNLISLTWWKHLWLCPRKSHNAEALLWSLSFSYFLLLLRGCYPSKILTYFKFCEPCSFLEFVLYFVSKGLFGKARTDFVVHKWNESP